MQASNSDSESGQSGGAAVQGPYSEATGVLIGSGLLFVLAIAATNISYVAQVEEPTVSKGAMVFMACFFVFGVVFLVAAIYVNNLCYRRLGCSYSKAHAVSAVLVTLLIEITCLIWAVGYLSRM
ncbi:MAG: hypothetical protein AAGC97_04785 [Planctomycetota bacterium]